MTDYSSWRYDEFRQVGTDYSDPAHVEAYDRRHREFRDVEGECRAIIDALDIGEDSVVIEIGAGTGAFAIYAAERCGSVHAVDVSQAMLDYAAARAADAGLTNVTFHHAGFLTYEHRDRPADAVVTSMALHHLPDFWKSFALRRINHMLAPGGLLYLHDVVFEDTDVTANISQLVDQLACVGGEQLRGEMIEHISREYSTFTWIMEGLLTRAGFRIEDVQLQHGAIATYLCVKQEELQPIV